MALKLTLHTQPDVPLEAEAICPDRLSVSNESAIAAIKVQHGNRSATIGDFFKIEGTVNGEIHLEGDLSRVKHLGAGMSSGKLYIHGDVGAHLGAGMTGGEITVAGNAGDWVGPEMAGGRISIQGNAGHLVGSAYRGSSVGMSGGEIFIYGSARNETGNAMRNGLIVIGNHSGDFTGVNMLAGTIIVMGKLGNRTGAGMKRGSIITMHETEFLPTFRYACMYRPIFLRMLLLHVQHNNIEITDQQVQGQYQRWCGDSVELNKGEILVLSQ
jgi:formylmethanofuran dehydrogenase subunit C